MKTGKLDNIVLVSHQVSSMTASPDTLKGSPDTSLEQSSSLESLLGQTSSLETSTPPATDALLDLINRHWGINELRPLQEPAINAVINNRDSLVVLPTGGGKSLCYQAPAMFTGGTTVVVSPLISLMKDQVDGLTACGVPAARLDSSKSFQERLEEEDGILAGRFRLLFVSPERLVQQEFLELLRKIDLRAFAIDEAHCVSHWGHDFRPEYRQLNRLRDLFPKVAMHAYTATATMQVRQDIINQLRLREPELLIGNFDRPNLKYRVVSRQSPVVDQVMNIIERYPQEGGIVYCISRNDVDELSKKLREAKINAMPYHAGMTAEKRALTQEAFLEERCDVVVATVAFGMGIDRSNVRYVIHAGMPKSLEHYQQEAGRAGRDGLPSECTLLYSGSDFYTWKALMEKSAYEAETDPSFIKNALAHLTEMDNYCRMTACRHGIMVRHFDQDYEKDNCQACDVCLGQTSLVENGAVVAQKIISCIARLKGRYGVSYVVAVLRGENSKSIRERGHQEISTHGILKEHAADELKDWIYQLIHQGYLDQVQLETNAGINVSVIGLNALSMQVLRSQAGPKLVQSATEKRAPRNKKKAGTGQGSDALQNDPDKKLFEALRTLRRMLAEEKKVPPYVIFSDATLLELCRIRPKSLGQLRTIYGIGDTKMRQYGRQFLEVIAQMGR